jgi:uncharacterized protein
MRTIKMISLVLVIVGALNWMLVGLFGFDLVATLTGDSFGQTNVLSSIVYVLVGIAGIMLVPNIFGRDPADAAAAPRAQ